MAETQIERHGPGPLYADGSHVKFADGAIFAAAGSFSIATQIATAVNCHDELLAACKAIIAKQGDDSMFRLPNNCNELELVRSAITLAERTP